MSGYPASFNPYVEPKQHHFWSTLLGPMELVTGPVAPNDLAISVEEAKNYLRIDGADYNAEVRRLIKAATNYVEQEVNGHRQILPITINLPVLYWWDGVLRLPRPPLQSVVSITYYNPAGTISTLDPSLYLTHIPWRMPGYIERAPNVIWPLLIWPAPQLNRIYPITIQFVAGYASQSAIPETLKQAILMLVHFWFYSPGEVPGTKLLEAIRAICDSEGYGQYA